MTATALPPFVAAAPIQLVGFIENGGKGCSPDSLIGEKGLLEIKTAQPDVLLDILDRDRVPPEHVAQLQGNLWVAEREWIDVFIYWPKLPPFHKRVFRDEPYISSMASAVEQFNFELAALVEKIRRYDRRAAA